MRTSLYVENNYYSDNDNITLLENNHGAFSHSIKSSINIKNNSSNYLENRATPNQSPFSSSTLYKTKYASFFKEHTGTDLSLSTGSISSGGIYWKSRIRYLNKLSEIAGLFPSIFFARKHYLVSSTPHKHMRLNKVSRQAARYSIKPLFSNLHIVRNIIMGSTGSYFFHRKRIFKKLKYNHKVIFKLVWRFFKLKVERFFFKMTGVRTHIWFMSVWQIFISGLPSKSSWEYFEAKKIIEYTRRGHRYVIESPEDAKFFIRIMVVMFTFVGGLRLFLERVSEWMADFRNHWAYIRFIAETMRRCSNFFWFRFFLNYRISLQGKIGGQLRAQKKIFNRGTISIESRNTMIDYHRCFSNTKFGIFNLSMWVQFKVPIITESFGGHTLIPTMEILLNRYTIPWLSQRLAYVIRSIDRDEKKRKSFKLGGDRSIGGRKYKYLRVQKKNRLPQFLKKKLLNKNYRPNRIL